MNGKKEKKALLPSSTTLAPKSRNSQSSIKNLQCRSSMTMKGAMCLLIQDIFTGPALCAGELI